LVIRVVDSGIGIDSEYQQKIFQEFSSVEARLDRLSSGLGLGLYIVVEHIKLMSGEIVVRSELGRGSCFELHLPAVVKTDAPHYLSHDSTPIQVHAPQKPELTPSIPEKTKECQLVKQLSKLKSLAIQGLRLVLIAQDVLQGFKLAVWLEEQGAQVTDLMLDTDLEKNLAQQNYDAVLILGFADKNWDHLQAKRFILLGPDTQAETFVQQLESFNSQAVKLVSSDKRNEFGG
jgi:hypothetical protein